MYDTNLCSVESIDHVSSPSVSLHPAVIRNGARVGLAELADMLNVPIDVPDGLDAIEFQVRRLHQGETLCRAGVEFEALYVVRSGFLKTVSLDGSGNEQVLAFPMRGDTIGVDGFDLGQYTADAIALDTSHVIIVPFSRIAALGRRLPGIECLIYAMFNRELVHRQNMVRLLGMLNAEARVASFLLGLSERYGRLGCSKSTFVLRMTRQELGSYLGIKLETVSRALSAFAAAGILEVSRREVAVNDMDALRRKLEAPVTKEGRFAGRPSRLGTPASSARFASPSKPWPRLAA